MTDEVTEADREAAKEWIRSMPIGLKMTLHEPHKLYAAFARHRTKALAAQSAEIERLKVELAASGRVIYELQSVKMAELVAKNDQLRKDLREALELLATIKARGLPDRYIEDAETIEQVDALLSRKGDEQ